MGQSNTSCPEAMEGSRIAVSRKKPGKRAGITGHRGLEFLEWGKPRR
jgi:hypothetical protein